MKYAVYILGGIVLAWFVFRTPVAEYFINRRLHRIAASSGLRISLQKVHFSNLKTLCIDGLEVMEPSSAPGEAPDTLLKIGTMQVNPAIFSALTGHLRLRSIQVRDGKLLLRSRLLWFWINKRKTASNKDSPDTEADLSYARLVRELERSFFSQIPPRVELKNLSAVYWHDSLYSKVVCHELTYRGKDMKGTFLLADNQRTQVCKLNGKLDRRGHRVDVYFCKEGEEPLILPYLGPRWSARLGVDTAEFHLAFQALPGDSFLIHTRASISGLECYHRMFSPDTVRFSTILLDAGWHFGPSSLFLDTASRAGFNGFVFTPVLGYLKHPCRTLRIGIREQQFNAQSFFSAMPAGLFTNFHGIKTKGMLTFSFQLGIPLDCPDSAQFLSQLEGTDFSISQFGETDFRLINKPFIHEVYEKEQLVNSFLVGEENVNYIPLSEISPFLVNAVLTSEDGAFFFHRGFNPEAFREALAQNIRERRFARGGSTISMQLVKNVFLSRKKTIARKAEEALIVWLIESQQMVSKERMLEVYLNIIEWGPGVYGIGAASGFYFNKPPSELNLQESLFLSAIVPRPKAFRYAFERNGQLKSYLANYNAIVLGHLLDRGNISDADTAGINLHLWLRGPASGMLKLRDTISSDSLFLPDKMPVLVPFPASFPLADTLR